MQEKINKRRVALLIALTIATVLVFWWAQGKNQVKVAEDVFQVEDLSMVSQVELRSGRDTVRLAFDDGRWRVNDRYDADAGMIRVLFATLQQARPKRRVATLREDSIFNQLSGSGVQVSLYAGDNLKKQFYAGGNSTKTQAFFADPASREVFVMAIPGYRVYVSGILELTEDGWRDKYVFKMNWENFKSLDVGFHGKPADDFTVSMSRDYFGIPSLAEADTAKLNTFLDALSLLTVDEYIPEPKLSDSLRQTDPVASFLVTDVANRSYRLRLYGQWRTREMIGIIQDTQVAVFDERKIQPLLKPKSFFRKK